jgi:hypothetical protein
VSAADGTNMLRGEGEYCDTINVQRPHNRKAAKVTTTPELPIVVLNSTPSSTGGMEDLSLTSPSIHESIQRTPKTPKRKRDAPIPERTLSSALRRLTAKPGTSKGSAHNPIILEEYSPRRKPNPFPTRVEPSQEPHKFNHRNGKLYTSRPVREPLVPKPANGIKFTGDKGSDLYRMINAKATAVTWTPHVTQTNVGYGVPFEIRYPLSAQYMAQQPSTTGQYQSPYARHHNYMGVSPNGDSEEMLRKKARHYTQVLSNNEHPRESSTGIPRSAGTNRSASIAKCSKKLRVYQDAPDDHITQLVAQSSLLTSLLQMYPKSADQKGLRDDIGSLVSAQKQRVEQWIQSESPVSSASRDAGVDKKDEAVRNLLSATAGLWRDGSGEGVADVFSKENREAEVKDAHESSRKRKLGVCGWDMECVI